MQTKTFKSKIGGILLLVLMGVSAMSHAHTPVVELSQCKTAQEAQVTIDTIIPAGGITFEKAMQVLQANRFQCGIETQTDGGKIWSCSVQYPLGGYGVVNYFVDIYPYDNDHMAPSDKVKSTLFSRNTAHP